MQAHIIKDGFQQHYRLHTPDDALPRIAIKPRIFRDPVLTEQFVRRLRVPEGYWPPIVARYGHWNFDPNATPQSRISQLLIEGRLRLYPVKHLHHLKGTGHSLQAYPTLPADKGKHYKLVPASLLLVNGGEAAKAFKSKREAEEFIASADLDDQQLNQLLQASALPATNDPAKRHALVSQALLEGKLIVIEVQKSASPPKETKTDALPAQGAGNKTATLGPHVGDDANASTKPVENTFKTQDGAAMAASKEILGTSKAEDIEYGGMIYKNQDGLYGYTGPIKGEEGSVNPGGPKSIPAGTTAVAYWHTHGAYNPDYDSENFSNYYDEEYQAWVGDIPYAKHYGVDAYVVTPKGNFKHYSVTDDKETLLGVID